MMKSVLFLSVFLLLFNNIIANYVRCYHCLLNNCEDPTDKILCENQDERCWQGWWVTDPPVEGSELHWVARTCETQKVWPEIPDGWNVVAKDNFSCIGDLCNNVGLDPDPNPGTPPPTTTPTSTLETTTPDSSLQITASRIIIIFAIVCLLFS